MDPHHAYDELAQRSRDLFTINSIDALVGWDQQVNMPPKGISHRAKMSSYLAQLAHRKAADPRQGDLLDAAEAGQWSAPQSACLREWRRAYGMATKLPESLVQRQAELTSKANSIWQNARQEDAFASFAPALAELIDISGEVADRLGWEKERYDALLDQYEPGLTTAFCDSFFADLRRAVVPLLDKIAGSAYQPDTALFEGIDFPVEQQRQLGLDITKKLGFDYEAGRLDASTHPFTTGTCSGDVRLTTRYDLHQPFQSLMGTIHEAGHGMYEQGLLAEHEGTPLGQTVSLGIHESQSRFFENNIGRNRAFWEYWYPHFQATFGSSMDGVRFERFFHLLNAVTPSLIRVEADEVTYNLHILVRFEIERDLFRGSIRVADLPEVWNEKYRAVLGITPPTDREGVLQDIHWSWAYFGYFPTYALGTVYAAQLEGALRSSVPDLDEQLRRGEFGAPLEWLRDRIHHQGMLYRPGELIQHATGRPAGTSDYVEYLTRKYGELYRL